MQCVERENERPSGIRSTTTQDDVRSGRGAGGKNAPLEKICINNLYFSKKPKCINSFLISLIYFRDNDQNIKYQFRETLNVMFTPKVFCTWRTLVLWVRLRRQLNVLKKNLCFGYFRYWIFLQAVVAQEVPAPAHMTQDARGKYFFWETPINFRISLLTIYCRSTKFYAINRPYTMPQSVYLLFKLNEQMKNWFKVLVVFKTIDII